MSEELKERARVIVRNTWNHNAVAGLVFHKPFIDAVTNHLYAWMDQSEEAYAEVDRLRKELEDLKAFCDEQSSDIFKKANRIEYLTDSLNKSEHYQDPL